MNSVIDNKFENSLKITNEYMELLFKINEYLSDLDKLSEFGERISGLRRLEDKDYDDLNLTQVDYYLSQLNAIDKGYVRILFRLVNRKNTLTTSTNSDNSKSSNTLNGIINLKGFKMVNSEISKLLMNDDITDEDRFLCQILLSTNIISLITFSLQNLFTENLLIQCNFNIDWLFEVIDEYKLDTVNSDKKIEIMRKLIVMMFNINDSEYQNVYFLLLNKVQLDMLLDYCDKEELETIKLAINTLRLNNYNKDAFNSIKRKIRQKEEELS